MSSYESKVLQVYPSSEHEKKAIDAYEAGGWELMSSDRIQESHGDTTSTFIRLRFRRDMDMPHYDQIRNASSYVEKLAEMKASSKNARILVWLGLIIGAFGLLFLVNFLYNLQDPLNSQAPIIFALLTFTSIPLALFCLIKAWKGQSKRDEAFKNELYDEIKKLKSYIASLK